MGKSARRSIRDDPSSPSSSPYLYYRHSTHRPETHQLWSPNELISTRVTSIEKALSQIKDVENKTSPTATTSLNGTASLPHIEPANGTSSPSPSFLATQKPATSTYKAFTSTYKSTSSTRGYISYTNRSDKLTELERLRMREEFFATYDVMTGIRIAATLGGFFVLMVFLVVYKSRSHSNKALRDPRIVAKASAAVQEEEDRELQEVYDRTAFSLYQDELEFPPIDIDLARDRITSLGNVSCPPYLMNPNLRFSSVGGYSSLLEPPRRFSDTHGRHRRQSSSSRILSAYHLNDNYSNKNENFFNESDGEEADDDEFDQRFSTTTAEIAYPHILLSVPRGADSRRSSGMTCCSTESSFLERRCSAITLGLSSLAPISRSTIQRPNRKETWEMDPPYPGIHIIEATPKSSPCPSERLSHGKDHIKMLDRFKRRRNEENSIDSISEYPDENIPQHYQSSDSRISENVVINSHSNIHQSNTLMSSDNAINLDNLSHQQLIRRAPLASLSSFKMSSIECQDSEEANGSVFGESCADTDDDMEQFSTDSDEISLQSPPTTDRHIPIERHHLNGEHSKASPMKDISICDASVVVDIGNDDVKCSFKSHSPYRKPIAAAIDKVNVVHKTKSNSIGLIATSESIIESEPCEIIERQRSNDKLSTPSASYSGCISSSDKKSNSSECVTINVVELKNNENSSVKPSNVPISSVILEMPVLVKQDEASPATSVDPDPSIPGPSRKWSKETLF